MVPETFLQYCMFPGTYVPRYRCSPVPMFPRTYVPRNYVPCVCSGSSTSATKASVNAPSNQQHRPSYDNAACAGSDISNACHPPSLYEESLTSTLASMGGRYQEAAPKPDGRIQSNMISILLASTPSMPHRWSMTDPVEGLRLRTANARTRAWPLSQVSHICSPNLCSTVPMFPGTYVPPFAVNNSSTPSRLIFLSLQVVMIITFVALVVSVSVRQRPAQFG